MVDISRNRTFEGVGLPILTPLSGGLLKPRGLKFKLLKSTFSAEKFTWYACCLGLSLDISAQFTPEIAPQPKIAKKITETHYFGGS